MVRDILVKICKDQQQLEHAVALIRIRVSGAFLEILHDCERIGEQPFQIVRVQLLASMRAFERLVCAQKSLIKKMVQTKLLTRESRWERIRTSEPAAPDMDSGCHDSPRDLEATFLRGTCRRD
jgi:hypothetical protein